MAHLYFEHAFSGGILNTEIVLFVLRYAFVRILWQEWTNMQHSFISYRDNTVSSWHYWEILIKINQLTKQWLWDWQEESVNK